MKQEQQTKASVDNPVVIDTRKRTTVYSTKKDTQHKTGAPIECTEILAEYFIAEGFAAATKDEALATDKTIKVTSNS